MEPSVGARAAIARQRANELLRALLTAPEYAQVVADGYLEVRSPSKPGRTYRIPRGPGFVRVFEQDKPVVDLCVQPTAPLPADDVVILHKLMIEGSEQDYLATANHFPIWTLPPMRTPLTREAPTATPPITPRVARMPRRRAAPPSPPAVPVLPHLTPLRLNLRRADLQGRNLRRADFGWADLIEAHLAGADMQWAFLFGANLNGADLRGADLYGAVLAHALLLEADLRRADLGHARLREASLREARLQRACLHAAMLERADLRGANLEGADLQRANLRGANLDGANLCGADLRAANLRGASMVGTRCAAARYTAETTWPADFQPPAVGALLVER